MSAESERTHKCDVCLRPDQQCMQTSTGHWVCGDCEFELAMARINAIREASSEPDLCSACGKPAKVLLTGTDLGHAFTAVPYCDKCAIETGWESGVEITKAVNL